MLHEIVPAQDDDHRGNECQSEHAYDAVDENTQERAGFFIRSLAHDEKNFDDVAASGPQQEEVEKHSDQENSQAPPVGNDDALHLKEEEPAFGLQE